MLVLDDVTERTFHKAHDLFIQSIQMILCDLVPPARLDEKQLGQKHMVIIPGNSFLLLLTYTRVSHIP